MLQWIGPDRGIYGLWSQNRDMVYVGSSENLKKRRQFHNAPVGLGCVFEVVLDLSECTKKQIREWEDRAILALRLRGVKVTNPTNEEIHRSGGLAANAVMTKEQRSANGRAGARVAAVTRSKEQWAKDSRKAGIASAKKRRDRAATDRT